MFLEKKNFWPIVDFCLEIAFKKWGSGCPKGVYYFQVWRRKNWKGDELLILFKIFKKFTQGFLEEGTGAAFLATRSKTEKTFDLFLLKFTFCNASATALQRSYCEVFVGNCHFSTSLFVYIELSYYRTVFCAHARTVTGCAEPVFRMNTFIGKRLQILNWN